MKSAEAVAGGGANAVKDMAPSLAGTVMDSGLEGSRAKRRKLHVEKAKTVSLSYSFTKLDQTVMGWINYCKTIDMKAVIKEIGK